MACETPAFPEPPPAQSNTESGRVDSLRSAISLVVVYLVIFSTYISIKYIVAAPDKDT